MRIYHTPGPWVIGKRGRIQTETNRFGGCIIIVDEGAIGLKNNMRLITAAPELFAALRAIMGKIRSESGSDDRMEPFAYDADWEQLAISADAALAKAEGKS